MAEEWWTAPAESQDGRLIMVSGRKDVQSFRANPRFKIRIEVSWVYSAAPDAAMPDDETAQIMEEATDALQTVLKADPVAVMTGIYTGAGRRDWIFYTLSTHIFQKKTQRRTGIPTPAPAPNHRRKRPRLGRIRGNAPD